MDSALEAIFMWWILQLGVMDSSSIYWMFFRKSEDSLDWLKGQSWYGLWSSPFSLHKPVLSRCCWNKQFDKDWRVKVISIPERHLNTGLATACLSICVYQTIIGWHISVSHHDNVAWENQGMHRMTITLVEEQETKVLCLYYKYPLYSKRHVRLSDRPK